MAILRHDTVMRNADGQTMSTMVTTANIGTYGVAANSTYYVGTTQNVFNRASGAQSLTGVSIDGNAATATNVAWTGITGGARTNYLLEFQPPASSYAGFAFKTSAAGEAGYFLIRGTSDADVYTAEGITLVADAGWLTLAQRTTASRGVKIMTGTASLDRFKITTAGDVQIVNGNSFTYNSNVVIHAGNYTSYPDATKLPLSGGTLTGNLTITKAGAYLYLNGTNSDSELRFMANGSDRWAVGMNVGDATENLNIYNYTTTSTNFTILKASGNVGINQATPAYKLDVSGTGRFTNTLQATRLNFGADGATPYSSAAGEGTGNGITFGGDEAGSGYRIFTTMENVGGNYSKLTLNWHTGIRIGAYTNYGGVRFYNNSFGTGTEIFSVGSLDSNVRVVNSLIVNGITINQERATNARMYGTTTGAFGLLGVDSAGSFRWQIYGDASSHGFLDSTWGNWDIKKTINGELDLRVSSALVRVLNAGNYQNYALPLTGGTLTGKLTLNSTGGWNDTQALLTVGGGADGRIQVRHIWGKSGADNTVDHLWLNYTTGTHVQIGASGGGNNLYVAGNIYAGGYFAGNLVLTSASTLTAGNLSGTIPSGVLGNSTHFIGTTSIALNRGSASQTLTGVSIDGNAATATILQTARTIGGVSFNGSAAIDLPGVNTAGNQNTTGNAASATYARRLDDASRSSFTVGGNKDNYYPVIFNIGSGATALQYSEFVIERGGYEEPGYTFAGGNTFSTLNIRFSCKSNGWGYGASYENVEMHGYTTQLVANWQQMSEASKLIVWLRGATIYYFWNVVANTTLHDGNSGGTSLTLVNAPYYSYTYAPTATVQTKALYTKYVNGSTATSGLYVVGNVLAEGAFIGALTGNVTGNVSGSSGSCTGNAATATILQTARTIGGVSFNGSANINLPGVNAGGNQNTTGSSASCTGNAASATVLATARTIGGVSFDGSANINLPGVNTGGTQNTSGTSSNITAYTINQNVGSSNSPTFATLQLTRLNFGADNAQPWTVGAGGTAGTGLTFGGDYTSSQAYKIFTAMENVGGNYSKLTLNWHTGIRIGAYYGYGGTRFYNNLVGEGTEIFSVGNGDSNVRVVNNLLVTGSIGIGTQSPSNKTTIEADATGASFADNSVAQLVIRGATNTAKRLGLGVDTTNNIGVIQAQLYGTGAYPLALNPVGGNVGIGTTDFSYTINDNSRVVGSNTNNRLFVNGSIQLLGNNDAIVFGRGTSTFLTDEELGFGWGGGWYMTEATYLRVRNDKTLYSAGEIWGAVFKDSNNSAYYLDPANSGTSLLVAGNIGVGTISPGYKLDVSGTGRFTGDLTLVNLIGSYQNTTVYNSANTLSTTPSRGIRAQSSSIQFTDSYAIAPFYTYRSTGDWPVPYGIGWGTGGESSGIFQRYASNGSSFGDMIFYTGNDGSGAFSFRRHTWEGTTYFGAGSGELNTELFRVDWAGNVSMLGTLNGSANSATLYANPSSYGSWKIGGTRNGWYGIEFESGTNLMANSNEVGFHRNGYGWQMRWYAGTGYISKGNPGGGTEAAILDSNNVASYALPIGGGTLASTNDQILTLNKSSGTGWGYIGFSQAGTRRFYFGLNASFEPELGVDNGGTFRVLGGMTVAGNTVLTTGNYTSYALPLAGGTLTGTLNGTTGSFSTKVLSSRFHDSGDAFLFRSGSGAGTTRHINLADSGGDPSSVGSATGITCGERSDNAAYYMIYVKAPYNNGSSTHSRLVLGWHTGMEIGASATYGGVRFMADSPGVNTSEIFSVGKGDSNVRVANTLYVGGNVALHAGNVATYALPLNPDGDGVCVAYSDENPTFNGVAVGGGWYFGADGSTTYGGLTAKILNAFGGGVNSTNGYYVGNNNFLANSGTTTTTLSIDGSNNHFATELTISGVGMGAYNLMKYSGLRSGDWQTFTTTEGQLNVIQVNNFAAGGHSNYPTGVYTYGAVMSWRTSNHSFQLYASHTGDLAYKTQWQNDNYSGWRRILDSTNYVHAANMNQYVRTTDNPTFNSVLITSEISISKNNARNLQIQGSGGTDSGLLGRGSSGQFAFQLYGSGGGDYGFLDGAWAGWDIRKTVDGNLYLNDNNTYYLNPASLTNLLSLTVANTITGAVSGSSGSCTGNANSATSSGCLNSDTGNVGGNRLQYWQLYEATPSLNPSADWYNAIRMGHGDPVTYYGNTLAVKMTGSNLGDIYTRTLTNGTQGSWNRFWNNNNDGAGSGLDADLLDGYNSATANTANTIVLRDGSGNFSAGTMTGTASNASQFQNESISNFMRGLAGGTEANIDTYTDNGFRTVAYTGHGKGLLSFNVGSSIGIVQHEYFYNVPNNGWRVRNKTDSSTWSAWGNVVMTNGNQGLLTGNIITTTSNTTVSGLNIGGNAASASSLAADTSTRFKVITFTGEGYDSGNGNAGSNYGIYQQGGSWTYPYPDLCIGFHTGIKIGAQTGYGGIRFYNTETWGTEIFSVGNGDNNVRVVNTIYAGAFSGPLTGNVTGNLTGLASSATTAGNVNGYSPNTGAVANTIVVRDANNYIYAYYINTNVSESENPSINSFFTSNGDGWLRKSTVAHVKYTLSLSGTNTGDQTNISGSSGSCTGNAASVTDGVYLSTNQSISGVKTFSSAPIATNIAKAWVHYNMNNNTINASFNVSSVTDNGTGVCTVNFSTAMVDANYVVAGTSTYGYDDQDIYAMILAVPRRSTAQQAGSCRLATEFIHGAQVYDCVAVRAVFYR